MPNTLSLTEDELDYFLHSGNLIQNITVPVLCLQAGIQYGHIPVFTAKELLVYNKVLTDLSKIEQMLNSITGIRFADSLFEQEQNGNSGYKFERLDYIGRHVISIKRPEVDNFYWTIGVAAGPGPANDSPIYKYYNMGTNGNIADLTHALDNTKHLFPATTLKTENARVMHTRARSYVMKF